MRNTVRARIYAALKANVQNLPVVARVISGADLDESLTVPEGRVVAQIVLGADSPTTPRPNVEAFELPVLLIAYLPKVMPLGADDEEFSADVCGDLYTAWWSSGNILGGLAADGEVDSFCAGVADVGGVRMTIHAFTLKYRFEAGNPTGET